MIRSLLHALQAGVQYEVVWACADNSDLPLDALGTLGMQQALAAHGAACHARSQAFKARIDAAGTLDELATLAAELEDITP